MINSVWIVLVCIMVLITPSLSHASKTHSVKKHESLYSLAKKYHVPVAELKTANNLVSTHIKPGDVLVIPPRSAASGAEAPVKNSRLKDSPENRPFGKGIEATECQRQRQAQTGAGAGTQGQRCR
jgi:murein DD-endopeptidase MepM/ murein hydrolase activator NlpD